MCDEKSDHLGKSCTTVISVGNAWVLCKSKSYHGHKYYFNTLTGKAVWNLSDEEINKAKNSTRSLENQQTRIIGDCPEPTEPPMDHDQGSTEKIPPQCIPTQIYNKQVINNGFLKQPYELAVQSYSHMMPTVASIAATSSFNAMYNPSVWALPSPQIYLTPDFLSQSQSTVNVTNEPPEHGLTIQSTAMPLSNRFQVLNSFNRCSSPPKKIDRESMPRRNHDSIGRRLGPKRNFNKAQFNIVPHDLRELLSAKRKQEHQFKQDNKESKAKSPVTHEKRQDSDDDSDWLEENVHVHGTSLSLDITKLKELAKVDASSDVWFIATDQDIMLKHLNFLNILLNSDEKCHLLVPHQELTALEKAASGDSVISQSRTVGRARRAVTFLRQLIATGSALVGEDCFENNDFNDAFIFNCCLNLSKQNYHVVVLSENQALKKFKSSGDIPIFTIKEIKKFLTSPFLKPNAPVHNKQDIPSLSAIKIVIPNNELGKTVETSTTEIFKNVYNTEVIKTNKGEVDVTVTSPNISTSCKATVDVEVQTEIAFESNIPTSKHNMNASQNDADNVSSTTNNSGRKSDQATSPQKNNTSIKKGIRLNRSSCHQITPTSIKSEDKKTFRWRKKRNTANEPKRSCVISNATNSQSDTTQLNIATNSSVNSDNYSTSYKQAQASNGPLSKHIDGICLDDDIDSESSSSVIKNTSKEKVIIEDTSTSGIVSNTSIDSENDNSRQSLSKGFLFDCTRESNKDSQHGLMFELNDSVMEDCLRMRCDEWVSRFFQIMEEVLSQVLQQDPQFLESVIPPPWSLYEACECTKVKFVDNTDVVYAASELMEAVLKFSDMRGKKHAGLSAQEFMHMYIYGVHLVKTLKGIVTDCEDLQTAEDSLAKLLNDIQNPNSDASHNDTFGDCLQETQTNVTQTSVLPDLMNTMNDTSEHLVGKEEENKCQKVDENKRQKVDEIKCQKVNENKCQEVNENKCQKVDENKCQKVDENKCQKVDENKCQKVEEVKARYNLRTRNCQTVEIKKKPTKVKFIRNINVQQEKFFSSLSLQKKKSHLPFYAGKTSNLFGNIVKDTEGPTVIRNFTKCLQYEERILEAQPLEPLLNHIDYQRFYEDMNFDEFAENNNSTKENNHRNIQDKDTAIVKIDDDQIIVHADFEQQPQYTSQVIKENDKICALLNRHIKQIGEVFEHVNAFCKETQREIISCPNMLNVRKTEICIAAENAFAVVEKLCINLDRIINRENYVSEINTQSVLNRYGVNNYSNKQFLMYRDLTIKCMKRANHLLKCLKCISLAVKVNNSPA